MRTISFFVIVGTLLAHLPISQACTSFAIPNAGKGIVAKSFEWDLSMGMAVHNKRGVQKRAILFSKDEPLSWQSRFSSLTFSQHGREFPLSGMNEKGLVVEIMILSSSKHPTQSSVPGVNELQWIQYILDTSANTEEAIRQARKARVIPLQQKVHYLACDAASACASFEYINGRLTVHSSSLATDSDGEMPVPTLANSTYSDSLKHLKRFQGFGGRQSIPSSGSDSLTRFVIASSLARNYGPNSEPLAYSFNALHRVSPASQWHLVWEPNGQRVHFRTAHSAKVKTIEFSQLNGSCRSNVQLLDMEGGHGAGDITSRFQTYSTEAARAILEKNSGFDAQLREVALAYPGSGTECKE